ncbi:MAG: small multi-drug export protein [Haliscomenobacter sp.]|uniref:small multi-drug export protein n=1 Tax=Haliscomenobacter sp. TaxID=2717303 RepID=UPI0029A4482E|nr:small multi-drug export protein [Haliscomenobacter sp.]MDX2071021.1 small multi-drug export protein [Haliscomenobacter sp.]
MSENIVEYLSVLLSSSFKFLFGPLQGKAYGLPWLLTAALTAAGMMLSVVVFTYFGQYLKQRFFKTKKVFTPANRRKVTLWRRYGIIGVALFTPLLLTPIGGTLVANAFGEKREKIFFWMSIFATIWGILVTLMVYEAGDLLQGLLHHPKP